MKKAMNALSTKLAGRVKPFLNIPTALMTALAVGGFGLSLWMVDDSMKDQNAMSHMRGSSAQHANDPLTTQSCTDNYVFDANIQGVGTVKVRAHYYNTPGAPEAGTLTVEATAYGKVGVELTSHPSTVFCYFYTLDVDGYARVGYFRNRKLIYYTDNLDRDKEDLICRHLVTETDPETGAEITYYENDTPKYIADNAYAGVTLRYGASQHFSHESHAKVTAGAELYRGPGVKHTPPTFTVSRTHGVVP